MANKSNLLYSTADNIHRTQFFFKISQTRFHFTERQNKTILKMEDLKKRKMDEAIINGSAETLTTQDYLRSLLDPLNKPQLVDLLSRLYVSLSSLILMICWFSFLSSFHFLDSILFLFGFLIKRHVYGPIL